MKEQLIEEIKKALKDTINHRRYIHTMGVVKASIDLAEKYGEDSLHATIAALLHDYAKDYTRDQLLDYVAKHHLTIDPIMFEAHELLHGKVAASIAQNKFHIDHQNILKAIENHTTGGENMSKLEKIIYLADFIEEGRNYPGVDQLRKTAKEDLDKAVLQALNNTIIYVLSIEKLLHPNTLFARNEMLKKLKKY
ncbi:bis(5'-nucleosyl)-tetraphosphatase (symmetrical) YqeK [Clostridium formicaceticum]|uniref:bis(5'-nucleosyl)-tetraphosphatase (symmetrical) n=1 Tax=Clostridium formicaceticum TaxID=1497 RepID=A0AAC9RN69_9CLOT|nr:bis(5'-nucleosyl)-tetraphosphatase (symmetrical) YqeK [Clostridium formicaceticum]AOY76870.1 phosphohydrolase [Clostridium formicaceticum]ARE87350.1 putative nicotinate-nucleotide adenylyltransferase [Clostridium formicaceticum]